MSFARRVLEAWRKRQSESEKDRILEWQLRLRLAKHFHQGVSDEPPNSVGATARCARGAGKDAGGPTTG